MRFILCALAAAIAASAAIPVPARASFLPPPSELMTPEEQSLLGEAVRAGMAAKQGDSAAALSLLDSLLAKDLQPTKFRGYVQMLRSKVLLNGDRNQDAIAAADEAVRLLPGYSGPLLTAMEAYAYSDRPGEAADFLLRATEIDPDVVRVALDDYEMFNLMHRLEAARDDRRLQSVSDRMLAIGWRGQKLDSRSNLAVDAIRRRITDGDIAGARALIPELLDPQQTYKMLASNRYQPLWADLEKWAGPKLSRQWRLYLTEARSRWKASHAPEAAEAYLNALLEAGRYSEAATDMLPVFLGKLDKDGDYDLIFRVTEVARALDALGRWNDVRALYAAAERTWPVGEDVNALNIIANEARYALSMGEPKRALDLIDRSIAEAERHPGALNRDAIVGMHLERTCILYRLGRTSEAGASLAIAVAASDVDRSVHLRLCIGDMAAAREALIRALADDSRRDDAIAALQPDGTPPPKSAYEIQIRKQWDALRTDPAVLAELAKYGRILPFTLNEGAQFAPGAGERQAQPGAPVPVAMTEPRRPAEAGAV